MQGAIGYTPSFPLSFHFELHRVLPRVLVLCPTPDFSEDQGCNVYQESIEACRPLLGAIDDVIGTHEGRREGLKKMPGPKEIDKERGDASQCLALTLLICTGRTFSSL